MVPRGRAGQQFVEPKFLSTLSGIFLFFFMVFFFFMVLFFLVIFFVLCSLFYSFNRCALKVSYPGKPPEPGSAVS